MMRMLSKVVAILLWSVSVNTGAAVILTLYNTVSLVDSNGAALANGDILQLIHTGPNWIIDAPDAYGNPGGDDTLVTLVNNPTYIGIGVSGSLTGRVAQSGMTYDDSLIGTTNAYVRYWNDSAPHLATGFGVSDLLDLPAGDPFLSLAQLDFVPLISNSHQVNIMFNALEAQLVPEPSTFAFALFLSGILAVRRRWRNAVRIGTFVLPFAVLTLCLGGTAHGQIPARLDVNATVGVVDGVGNVLPGNHPDAALYGFTPIPGSVVQLLDAGGDGLANIPDAQGNPTGDDVVLMTSQVGAGIAPNVAQSGRFSFFMDPGPGDGSDVYVRVFDKPTVAESTQWGQSICFTVDGVSVFTVNRLGLWGTIVPKSSDPGAVDSDGDGHNDLEELIANTSAGDASDYLAAGATTRSGAGVDVGLSARAGRDYRLMRKTDGLMTPTAWQPVASLDAMAAPQDVVLQDPSPPTEATEVYYSIDASMP